MSSTTLVLASDRVLLDGELRPASVHIRDGLIVDIKGRLDYDTATQEVRDFGSLVVMPGVVDSHVHVNEPGRDSWEGFATATKAAAAGGVTFIADMPLNSSPVTTSMDALEVKLAAARGKLWVDTGFLGGIVPGNSDQLVPLMRDGGVLGFKCFLCHSGIDEFPQVRRDDVLEAHRALSELSGALVMYHAEVVTEDDAQAQDDEFSDRSAREYHNFLGSRPPEIEVGGVQLAVEVCNQTRVRSHIVHVSSREGVRVLRDAQERGLPISGETCPHYLYFDADCVPDGGTHYKCVPPIRDAAQRDALWQALDDGTLTMVVSDHSPCETSLKNLTTGNFFTAWGGIAGLQVSLRAVWTEARTRGLTVPQVSKFMSHGPASLLGLDKQKGHLRVGYDADVCVWDPDAELLVDQEKLEHLNKVTPYHGRHVFGRVHQTLVRGRTVFESFDDGTGKHSSEPLGQMVFHKDIRGA